MSFWFRAVLGLALMAAAAGGLALAIYELSQIGTCASGGPYESARPCPGGTGWWIVSILGSVPAFMVGVAVFNSRGSRATKAGLPDTDSPTANPRPFGSGIPRLRGRGERSK